MNRLALAVIAAGSMAGLWLLGRRAVKDSIVVPDPSGGHVGTPNLSTWTTISNGWAVVRERFSAWSDGR